VTILNKKIRVHKIDLSSALLIAAIILGLMIHVISCVESQGDQQADDFVLNENDYSLDCDVSGDSGDALACQLAYHANRRRMDNPAESDHADPLKWSDDLADVGYYYCQRMCDEIFFDHSDPEGRTMESRLQEAGVFYVKAGENLARGSSLLPSRAMAMFMNEPPCEPNHRANVLDKDFTHTGVGAYFCGSKVIYTQLFAAFDAELIGDGINEFCLSF